MVPRMREAVERAESGIEGVAAIIAASYKGIKRCNS
jgi:hypothetical protein